MGASDWDDADFEPRRAGQGLFFKPHPETVWPAPDAYPDGGEPDIQILRAMANAYCNLLTHPCGVDMLKSARRGWKWIRKEETRRV